MFLSLPVEVGAKSVQGRETWAEEGYVKFIRTSLVDNF